MQNKAMYSNLMCENKKKLLFSCQCSPYIKMFKNRRRADGQHEKILKTKARRILASYELFIMRQELFVQLTLY